MARTSCLIHTKDDWQNQEQGKHYQEMRSPFAGWADWEGQIASNKKYGKERQNIYHRKKKV